MKDVNKVILIGRLGADPIQRQTKAGTSVASFSIATTRKFTRDSSSPEKATPVEETQWHRIVAWGRVGEVCAQYLKKGNPVFVEGTLRSRQYEGKDGSQHTSFEVHTDNVSFLGAGGKKPTHEPTHEPTEMPIELPVGAL